jgi:hypothetical protein
MTDEESTELTEPGVQPHILLLPLLQPPPAGRRGRILVGQKAPRRPGLQYPQNTLQTGPIGRPRTAWLVLATLRLWQQKLDQLPPALRSTTQTASCSCKKLIKPPTSCRRLQREAQPIYGTRSSRFSECPLGSGTPAEVKRLLECSVKNMIWVMIADLSG